MDSQPLRLDPHTDPATTVVEGRTTEPAAPGLSRALGLFDMTMLVMGSVIGVGIFATPHAVAIYVGTPSLVLGAWILGGLVTLAGSLVYAELARRRPHVGGQYAFLREAYHPGVAFVYGWSLFWIMQSGGMASVAVVFSQYFLELVNVLAQWLGRAALFVNPTGDQLTPAHMIVTSVAIGTLAIINCLGVRAGGTTQNIFMTLKILAIAMLVVCGLLLAGTAAPESQTTQQAVVPPDGASASPIDWLLVTAFAAAMVQVLFSYGGSHTTTFVAGEVRDPRRTVPRALVLGVTGVMILYVAVNFVCLRVLGVTELAATEKPAAEVMRRAFGDAGAALISLGIAISAIGFISQATLTSPRVYYAMAKDGLFFQSVAWVHPRTRVPVVAILIQGVIAMVIAVSGSFRQIVNYVMTVELLFLSLTALSLFIMRRRDAADPESAGRRTPGHPFTTLLFAVVNVALVIGLLYREPKNSAIAVAIALAGVPVYFFWRWHGRRGSPNLAVPTATES
jgi:APA family basic amino acid/polyamine antiporter